MRGDHVIYERNADYWDSPRPYLDQLVVKFIPDAAARSAALESGEVDLGYRTPVAYSDLDRLRAAGKLEFETKGYEYNNNVNGLEFNLDTPYLAKLPVRQAIAHAINTAAICKTVYYGTFDPCAAPIAPYLAEYHDPEPFPYPYDIAKAEKLLDEAGFPRGADGTRFHMMFDVSPAVEEGRRLGRFPPRVVGPRRHRPSRSGCPTTAAILKRIYTDRDFDMCCTGFSNIYDPSVGVQRVYWSKNIIKGVPFSNTSYYRNPEGRCVAGSGGDRTRPGKAARRVFGVPAYRHARRARHQHRRAALGHDLQQARPGPQCHGRRDRGQSRLCLSSRADLCDMDTTQSCPPMSAELSPISCCNTRAERWADESPYDPGRTGTRRDDRRPCHARARRD